MAAVISRKSRPKSLRKRSIASSNLPTLCRKFSNAGVNHHEVIDVNMSSTNELIMNAFKDLKIGSKAESTASSITTLICDRDDKVSSETSESRTCGDVLGEHCILTEAVELCPSIECGKKTRLQPSILDDENQQTFLKTPLSALELRLGKNVSSSSIDSGVYSLRGSKRPSFEQASPLDSSQVQPLRGMSGKRSSSADDSTTHRRSSRFSVSEEAFSELLQAATKLVLDANPMDEQESTAQHHGDQFLKNSLRHFKRRKSECDIVGLKPPQHEKVSRKRSAEPVLQRISTRSSEVTPNSRRLPACIICERNNHENAAASVLIKTTMVRTVQMKRRFSEVLKVKHYSDR
jgi:hypothetical protein